MNATFDVNAAIDNAVAVVNEIIVSNNLDLPTIKKVKGKWVGNTVAWRIVKSYLYDCAFAQKDIVEAKRAALKPGEMIKVSDTAYEVAHNAHLNLNWVAGMICSKYMYK